MQKGMTKKAGQQPAGLAVNDVFDRWFNDLMAGRVSSLFPAMQFDWQPKVDVSENDKEITISASVPGVDKKDISVEVADHTLAISGERKEESEEKKKGMIRQEQAYGTFYRSFQLPENARMDQIKANAKNGLLEIHIPKSEEAAQAKGKKISVE